MIRRSLRYAEDLSEAVQRQLALAYRAKDLLGFGLRQRLRERYAAADFRADLLAALIVAAVALPLSMAVAIAAGARPEMGLYTAIIAGVTCSLLGGARLQITGPAAAFAVILLPIVHEHGLAGVLVAGAMAGVILLLLGLARLGKLMEYVPHPVTTGFTMGIAVVIAGRALEPALGLSLPPSEGFFGYLGALWDGRAGIHTGDAAIAAFTIALLVILPRLSRRAPAPLVALVAASVAAVVLHHFLGVDVATIGSKYRYTLGGLERHGMPPLPPLPIVPWRLSDAHHAAFSLDYHTIRSLLPAAFAIAMLGAIESLRSAVAADGMAGTRHEPNSELIALGIANIATPFFGGIAATGAISRTATNIRAGARSPFAATMQAIIVLACTIALAPLLAYLPMAGLAGLLVVVARDMSEARHFFRLSRVAPRHDVLVMLTCFSLTVVFDLTIAVTVGIVLAALLFMRRMSVLTRAELEVPAALKADVPAGVRVYEIEGPLFFGAAKSAMEALHAVGDRDHTYILDMARVPTVDATGLVALESALDRLHRSRIMVIFSGLSPEISDTLGRAGLKREVGKIAFAPDIETAVSMAIVHAARLRAPES